VEIILHTDLQTALESLSPSLGLFEPQGDDVLFRTRTDSIDWLARQLARLPFAFEIREPAALRDALCRHASDLLQRHGVGNGSG
jgi:predicted DNA-binding transcriptional regulator YafY